MQFRQSEIDGQLAVIEVELGDKGPVVDGLKGRGWGYAVLRPEAQLIVVDGRIRGLRWFTADHMLAIEAHETGHIQCGVDEEAADLRGIQLLLALGHDRAADLLRRRVHRA
jgi:hypothetical protein